MTAWEFYEHFEDAYVALLKAIRQLAYPKHPALLDALSTSSVIPYNSPAAIPIFIMRPLRGQFEHATQSVVDRRRADGDKAVFWLDTSGWLEPEDTTSEGQDFWLDEMATPSRWRLTERGNQRVAIFLHAHVCRYLAENVDKCPFLPPEVYQGKFFEPKSAEFDTFLANEKERKLKKLFW